MDGRPDEAAWGAAPPFDAFTEIYPREGATPRRRTEVRILYDDDRLYVAFRCEDERPEDIARPLGRRDYIPSGSDSVSIAIDAAHDGRTAYRFTVSAGGVLEDRLHYDDVEETFDWDAVWEAAVAFSPSGWTAELAIPFAALRFAHDGAPVFGVYLQRKVGHTHEIIASALIPLGAGAFVSRFPSLLLGPVARTRHLQLLPFVVGRLVTQPVAGEGEPGPRQTYPSGDVGLDLSLPLTSATGLEATVNPDFSQVEADPVILNLTRFEPFFTEKRPFFQRDLDLFQPVGGPSGEVPQQIVYTRRIGLDAPILAAGKLSGQLAPGLDVGVLDAFVAAASTRAPSSSGAVRFHPEQPLHLAPEGSYPGVAPAPENFFAGALRLGTARSSFLGLQAAIASPIAPRCSEADAALASPPAQCSSIGGSSGAALFAVRSADATLGVVGQIAGSRAIGGPPSRLLPDGTVVRPGDRGLGAYFTAGKLGGEPIRATVSYELATPRLDLNATGYQPDQNEERVKAELRFVRKAGLGPLHEASFGISGSLQRSTDGRGLDLGKSVGAEALLVLRDFHEIACSGGYDLRRQDLREIVAAGIAYERPAAFDAGCSFGSDLHRAVSFEVGGRVLGTVASPPLPGTLGWRVRAGVAARPHPRAEASLTGELEDARIPGRFVEHDDPTILFGDLSARTLSLKFRQLVVFTPRLTFQAYLQLFLAYERYGKIYAATATGGGSVALGDLQPSGPPQDRPDFTEASLRANLVLRWEYSAGSALYLVYTRTSDDLVTPAGTPRLQPDLLGHGPSTDLVLVKASFLIAR